jgi:hypothetical protein
MDETVPDIKVSDCPSTIIGLCRLIHFFIINSYPNFFMVSTSISRCAVSHVISLFDIAIVLVKHSIWHKIFVLANM